MAFFNQQQEVIDIKLTQFGKNSLSRGIFKPVYYRFFDDDILYNSEKAGFSEHQNDTETRILEETPRLKTQHLAFSVGKRYFLDDQEIYDRTKPRFEKLRRNLNPDIQDKVLKYPLGEQQVGQHQSPRFSVQSFGASFETENPIEFKNFDGINRKIPQIELKPVYRIILSNHDQDLNESEKRITEEEHFDFMSDKIVFNNGKKFEIQKQNISLSVEELSTFYGLENFDIEVFQINEDQDKEVLRKIDDIDELRTYFTLKTDDDVEVENKKTFKQRNYRRSEEY